MTERCTCHFQTLSQIVIGTDDVAHERIESTGTSAVVDAFGNPTDPCPFCTAMCWAAKVDARLDVIEDRQDRQTPLTEDDVDSAIERNLNDRNYIDADALDDYAKTSDVEALIEEAVDGLDIDDCVKTDDLADEILSAVEEKDLVKEAAAGAFEALVRRSGDFVNAHDFQAIIRRIEAVETAMGGPVAAAGSGKSDVIRVTPDGRLLDVQEHLERTPLGLTDRLRVLFTGKL